MWIVMPPPVLPARGILFVLSLLIIVVLILALRAVSSAATRRRSVVQRALILGTSPLARWLLGEIEARPDGGYAIAGVVDDGAAPGELAAGYPVFGSLKELRTILEGVRPDRVIVALAERRNRLPIRELLEARLRGIAVEDAVEVYERLTGKLAIEWLTPSSFICSSQFARPHLHLAAGRAMGVLAAVVGLLGLAPLMALIAIAIKLDSRGPVFFVQERVGMGGKRFNLIKFRTMHPVNRPTSEWVRDNGDRITRVGRWLRRFRLDELPQFVNILRGDMNLVGPRPHPASNFELFVLLLRNAPECGKAIPYYSLRSMVRPGITGWAQVCYRYANGVEEEIEKMRYDLYYIKHMSLWLDLRILLQTLKIVLLGRGTGDAGVCRSGAPDARQEERLGAA
jgi:exopolysaccharide biosynthesis polyprenyl glycosylphosphotransferase